MAKNKSNKRKNQNKEKGSKNNGINAPPRILTTIPSSLNATMKISRAIRRSFLLTSTTINGLAATTMQFTFSPGATDYRMAGTSIYSTAVPNSTEFSNLFDNYKVKSVTFRLDIPAGYSDSAATPLIMPFIYYVADYNDVGDASIDDLLQYPQVQLHNFYKDGYTPLMIKFSPKPLRDVAGSGISTSYGPMQSVPWIRTSEMSTPHYGLKLAFDWMGQTQTQSVPMVSTIWYELEFNNPK